MVRRKAAVAVSTAAIITMGAAVPLQGQGTSEADAESIAAIERLSFILGEWEGHSTAMTGPETRTTSEVTERASLLAGGTVLLLEGRGTVTENGETRVVHDAIGIITWDPAGGRYRMRAYRVGQGWTDSELRVPEHTLEWGMDSPGGRVRFMLDFSQPDRWMETGEIRRGDRWVQFLEMDLRRR